MRKIICFTLAALLLTGALMLPTEAEAADADSMAGFIDLEEGSLKVHKTASNRGVPVGSLHAGSYVTLISKVGSWWKVEYAPGAVGWCKAEYVSVVNGAPAEVKADTASLTVYNGPGEEFGRCAALSAKETVLVLRGSCGWSRIVYNGTQTGYVKNEYLTGDGVRYRKIALNVPDYKQTDVRWRNVPIGRMGETMAQIGCTTASIAMMESYRQGTTINPRTMSNRLGYSEGGGVMWPGRFKQVRVRDDYLLKIYLKLAQGNPVMLGVKKRDGGQHWVVVTGFTGGETLSTDKFTINDPGTSRRTTIEQLFQDYPYFYKLVFY